MQLILWRHADAEDVSRSQGDPRQRDLARELTLKGEKQAKLTAGWLRPRLGSGWQLLSSPAVRTLQTAQQLSLEIERVQALAPDAEPQDLLDAAGWPGAGIASANRAVVLVSHQPTLGRVASLLLSGVDRDWMFHKGAAWWFESAGSERAPVAALRAVFDPSLG